ncbi:MAG: hypothetical protein R3D67_20180 [Hyphomicrobiaceae bacterium]
MKTNLTPVIRARNSLERRHAGFVATYYGDPQSCQERSAKIFTDDGGSFSAILQSDLTAEKIRDAYELSRLVSAQVDNFKKLKRKRYTDDNERKSAYIKAFGSVAETVFDELDAAIPQITIFAMAALYEKFVVEQKKLLRDVVEQLRKEPTAIWTVFVELVEIRRALKRDNSWPTLLKAGSFYRDAMAHLKPKWQKVKG